MKKIIVLILLMAITAIGQEIYIDGDNNFLTITSPEVAIYMAGEGNSYGHPHEETLQALNAIGAEIYGTDIHGTIVVTTDGESYSVSNGPPIPILVPNNFIVTNLIISPNEVEQEEILTISVTVTNLSGSAGLHTFVEHLSCVHVQTIDNDAAIQKG